jgi:hypothetical protein
MDQSKTTDSVKQDKSKKPALVLWRIQLLLLLVVTGVTVVGAYLLPPSDEITSSQLTGISILSIILAVLLLLFSSLHSYTSLRYFQLPVWRWMANGFKGKPVVPWVTKSKEKIETEQ